MEGAHPRRGAIGPCRSSMAPGHTRRQMRSIFRARQSLSDVSLFAALRSASGASKRNRTPSASGFLARDAPPVRQDLAEDGADGAPDERRDEQHDAADEQ